MLFRRTKLLSISTLLLSCVAYSDAQFQWNFGCAQGTCTTATAAAYGMPPPAVHDVGGSWQWTPSRYERNRRAAGLYNRYCVRCHGVDGRGVWDVPDVPNFADPAWQSSRTDEQLARLTWEGRGAVMPAFRGTLTWDESWSLAHYIRGLAYQKPPLPRRNRIAPATPSRPSPATPTPASPKPATPKPFPTDPGPWRPVDPRPNASPGTSAPLFEAPSDEALLIETNPGVRPILSPSKDAKPALTPPEDSVAPPTGLPPSATDELLDQYFKEKPSGPNTPTQGQPVDELPIPRQSSSGANLPTYDLNSPILGNPTQTIVKSPSEIELRSYPAAIVSPSAAPPSAAPPSAAPPSAAPPSAAPQSAVPPYPFSAPPGPLPTVKRDFSSPLYRTR